MKADIAAKEGDHNAKDEALAKEAAMRK